MVPFLLASNLVTTVGTSKAERLLYLPSLGACLLEARLISAIAEGVDNDGDYAADEGVGMQRSSDGSADLVAPGVPGWGEQLVLGWGEHLVLGLGEHRAVASQGLAL